MRDWSGNTNSVFKIISASNHTEEEREENDFYATDPVAIDKLYRTGELTCKNIWECACGEGHLAKKLVEYGYNVKATDLIDRGYGECGVDFLACKDKFDGDILTNPPYKCFSSDTQCYTKRGWLFYNELTKDDEFLSLNPDTQEIEWSKANNIFSYDVDEELYHFSKSHLDILCTKGHRMYAVRDNKVRRKNGDLVHAEDITSLDYIPRNGYNWNGENIEYFTLPASLGKEKNSRKDICFPELNIKINDWLAFFGFWLADGCCRRTKNSQGNQRKTVCIKQKRDGAELVRNILNKLPFTYKEYIDNYNKKNECINFEINNQQLWSYLITFGTSENKFIPEFIKNLDTNNLKIFINFYFNGDGSIIKLLKEGEVKIFRTISKKLAEDVQEILLKLGYLSHITTQKYIRSNGVEVVEYVQMVSLNSKYSKMYYQSTKKVGKERYKGKVWCVNLKKNGVFLLKRNGNEFFSGNCAAEFTLKALDLIPDGNKVFMFLKLTFLEGKKRYDELFSKYPPKKIYVFSQRVLCAKNGDFDKTKANGGSAVAYAWYVWEKGYTGDTIVKWI